MTSIEREVTINVTLTDIDDGVTDDMLFCPVAIAVKRELFPVSSQYNLVDVFVDSDCVTVFNTWNDISELIYFELPRYVGEWIERYDKGYEMNPVSFTAKFKVSVPDWLAVTGQNDRGRIDEPVQEQAES